VRRGVGCWMVIYFLGCERVVRELQWASRARWDGGRVWNGRNWLENRTSVMRYRARRIWQSRNTSVGNLEGGRSVLDTERRPVLFCRHEMPGRRASTVPQPKGPFRYAANCKNPREGTTRVERQNYEETRKGGVKRPLHISHYVAIVRSRTIYKEQQASTNPTPPPH
jgi:hypothetical protein